IFYPACEKELGKDDDVLGESLVEHGLVEFSLFNADEHKSDEDFDKYITVLKEVVLHHAKEEEKELLPKAKRRLENEMLERLGASMEKRFEEAMEADFREPLRENLSQVLGGRTKTQKKPARANSANTRSAGPKAHPRTNTHGAEARTAKRRPAAGKKASRRGR
ncbi:MAG TPA: hypothetical protein VGQ57_18165, partial [Polyangiaceae bacterium]|nr:hypothetical protein [Polyangiaceae bacterium]